MVTKFSRTLEAQLGTAQVVYEKTAGSDQRTVLGAGGLGSVTLAALPGSAQTSYEEILGRGDPKNVPSDTLIETAVGD